MADPGELALVLHTHLPHVKGHGTWPVGEEWLNQAWAESWLPVTEVLLELADRGHRDVLSLSVSPSVAQQVADPRLERDLGTWIGSQMWQAEEQRSRYRDQDAAAVRELGPFYWRHYAHLGDLHGRVTRAGGLLAVWADLAARGVIEIMGGPATHPYLPLADDQRLIDAQLACGLDAQAAWAGRRPSGLWSPECGYRPAGTVADPTLPPLDIDVHGTPVLARSGTELEGLETTFARAGVTHFLVDAPTVVRAAGGADRDWTQRPHAPGPDAGDPYEVVHDSALVGDSDVAVFARDLAVAYHVWSPTAGYPGDPWYRDFHARGGFGTHPAWRVTDKSLPHQRKAIYEPDRAAQRAEEHAQHLHGVLRATLDPRPGAVTVAAYDTELFGHWWFEGPGWLGALLRRVVEDPHLRTTTLASRLERRPPTRRLHLPESSWGFGKGHGSWVTPATRWMWQELRRVEERARTAMGANPDAAPEVAAAAARSLALSQASDWPYMINRGDCEDYAAARFRRHVADVDAACDAVERGAPTVAARDDLPRDVTALVHALSPTNAPRRPDTVAV